MLGITTAAPDDNGGRLRTIIFLPDVILILTPSMSRGSEHCHHSLDTS
jgi:hypothetical protein